MNRTYNLVWNHCLGTWNVTSEHTSKRGKGAGAVLAAAILLPALGVAADLPTGGHVVSGSGSINLPSNNQMVIEQNSQKLAIDWQSFDIAAGNKVTFNQQGRDSVALNRVLGADGSKIMGQLEANGQVFVVNPSGVVFGKGAEVNVGGLVASTLDLSVKDFEAGHYQFKGDGNNAGVVNQGQLIAQDGGAVALLGGSVSNQGVIVAKEGTVALAAGNKVSLDFAGDGLLNLQVDEGTAHALVENRQLIKADGGQVLLTAAAADAVVKAVVNNDGVIQAHRLAEKDGKILLLADMQHGELNAAGTLEADFVETSAATVNINQNLKVDTQGGEWLIDPVDITIDQGKAQAIEGALTTGNVTVTTANNASWAGTVNGQGTAKGDIQVNADITYSQNQLTLNADNNINVNANIKVNGTGTLALNYGGTAGKTTVTPKKDTSLNVGGQVDFAKSGADLLTVNGQRFTVINDLNALQSISTDLNGRYALGANLDARATGSWNNGQGFDPIGSDANKFSGMFEGLGHNIRNLVINRSSNSVGLWGTNSGTISNIGLVDVAVTGGSAVGGLVGNNQGQVSNAYVTGRVSSSGSAGGLAGENTGLLNKVYSTANVTGNISVGGLAGYNSGTISNAYALGTAYGSMEIGGLVGTNYGSLQHVYALGKVTQSSQYSYLFPSSGGLVGKNNGTLDGAFWTRAESNQSRAVGEGSTTGAKATTINGFYNWDTFSGWDASIWSVGQQGEDASQAGYQLSAKGMLSLQGVTLDADNRWQRTTLFDGGYGTSQDPWKLRSWYHLQNISTNAVTLAGNYQLAYSIGQGSSGYSELASSSANNGQGWQPIGSLANPFTGTFSGRGEILGELYINRPDADYVGFFGYTNGASFTNLSVSNANITGRNSVGALVGYMQGGTINKVNASGSSVGVNQIGGIVGSAYGGGIGNSKSEVYVTATGDDAGGLMGAGSSHIADSYVTPRRDEYGVTVKGNNNVGGLVGRMTGTLNNSYAKVNVQGLNYVGGLVGQTSNDISNTYATGNVSGVNYLGGLAGAARNISYSYALGQVNGAANAGGLVGLASAKVTSSFYATGKEDGSTINNAGNYSGDYYNGNQFGSGKTWAEFYRASTFADWDLATQGGSSSVWRIYDGNTMPLLRSFLTAVTITPTATGDISKTYDAGLEFGTSHVGYITTGWLLGDLKYQSSAKDVGTYSTVDGTLTLGGLYSHQNAYDISYANVPTTLTINKANLSITGLTALNKTYDGKHNATIKGEASINPLGTDQVQIQGQGVATFDDKNAGTNKFVSVTGYSITGEDANNYNLVQSQILTAAVFKAPLSVKALFTSKTRNDVPKADSSGISYSGFVNNEDASVLSGELVVGDILGTFAASILFVDFGGLSSQNYDISYIDGIWAIQSPNLGSLPPSTGSPIQDSAPITAALQSALQLPQQQPLMLEPLAMLDEASARTAFNNLPVTVEQSGLRLPEGI